MPDRHDGFVVNIVFALGDVREDDAACIIDGIRQMKNVVAVEAAVFDSSDGPSWSGCAA